MIFVRGLAFLISLLLAAAMVVWQVNHLRLDIAEAFNPPALFAMMALGLGILAVQGIAYKSLGKKPSLLALGAGGLLALPLTLPVGALLSLIQLRSGDHRRIWTSVLALGVMLGMNVLLPLAVGTVLVGGVGGLTTGWVAVKLQFFVVVDYFLARAILYYFNSGASAFVSLRYLRRRVLSLLAVLGIGLGVLVLIVVNSIMTGFQTDFREQMRGSLSHLLVRFRSEDIQFRLNNERLAQAQWGEYVRRIESNDAMLPDWHEALDRALQYYRDAGDKDALPDPRDWLEAQPPIPPDDDDNGEEDNGATGNVTGDEEAFLERLRTGVGLTDFDRECLRDENGEVVTPRKFYLRRVTNPEQAAAEIRLSWYPPIFRESLQEEFDKAEKALKEHRNPKGERDVEGVSWRVSTKTFITPKSGSRELPIAELVGVDQEREPDISNLGEYVANAELTGFRDQYVLRPMLNILGATLGWETPDSLEATGAKPLFLYNETGESMSGAPRLPRDMSRYLAVRRLTTASGRVRWRSFDNVRFHEFSPARRVYERVRKAYKDASRTEDLERLGNILRACERDVRAILLPYLDGYETDERYQQVNHTGAKVMFFNYVSGYEASVRAVDQANREYTGWIQDVLGTDTLNDAEEKVLNALWEDLNELSLDALDDVRVLDLGEAEREERLGRLAEDQRGRISEALEEADADALPVADFLRQLRAYARGADELKPLKNRMELRAGVPLSYAAARYDESAAHVLTRMDAYRRVLPVRTFMRAGESPEDYFARARRDAGDDDMPGVILGDALADNALGHDVNIGDQIAITIPRIYREDGRLIPRTTEVWFRVTGLFRSGLYEENAGRMYCDFEALARILADSEIRYIVGARLADYRPYEGQVKSDALKADVRESLDNHRVNYLSVGVWEDETRTLLEAVNIERTLIGLIVSLIIVLAGGAIVIIVYQLVNEKVKDIGILKALGHSPWGIRSVFMFNALFIGLFGAIGGATLGILVSEYLNEIEDFVDEKFEIRLFPPDIYFLTYIPSVQGADLVWLAIDIAVPVVMFGFFCGILPSMAAARKDPVEALHYE